MKLLQEKGIVGLGFTDEEQRVYPLGHVASQVVGYAGTDNHGLAGLELGLEGALSGQDGSETVIRDPSGQAIDVLKSTSAREGKSVTLTIDHTIQAQAEAVLRETIDQWHAKAASAIVLDPRTGGILGMADRARVRREPVPDRAQGPPAQPDGYGHVRAGLDLQARDRQRASSRSTSSPRTRRSRSRTRSTSPTGSSRTPTRGAPSA